MSSVAAQSSDWLSMLSSTWSINARNSVSVIIPSARFTESSVSPLACSRKALRIVATLAAAGMLAACGFKGPLYLPPQEGQSRAQPSNPPPPSTNIPGSSTPQLPSRTSAQ
ncbi:LPS translocon maturation chaperone LptM [Bordetella genomosp. 13]|uniref:LPS translocon maturation chaperone LptM n=1 Tax=Bordetella genomosp. 13 TaxID=463040 RepID=UPI00391EEE4D